MSGQNDIEKLLDIHKRRLQKLQEQKAMMGISTPPHILLEIETITEEIQRLEITTNNLVGNNNNSHNSNDIDNSRGQKFSIELQQKIVDVLLSIPSIHDGNMRRTLIYSAGLEKQLQDQIVFNGSTVQFIRLLVETLSRYGELKDGREALEAILEATKQNI